MARIKRKKLISRLEYIATKLDKTQSLMDEVLGKDAPMYIVLYNTRCELEDLKEDIKEKNKL